MSNVSERSETSKNGNGADALANAVRAALPPAYAALEGVREAIGAPHLLNEARAETAKMRSEVERLRTENRKLRTMIDAVPSPEPVAIDDLVLRIASLEEAIASVRSGAIASGAFVPSGGEIANAAEAPAIGTPSGAPVPRTTASGRPKGKGGRPANEALRAYLRSGLWANESNETIAKKFKCSPNTVRRNLWEMGLLKNGGRRRRRRGGVDRR